MARQGEFERLLAENQRYTETFDRSSLTAAPLRGMAIVACMDARLDVEEALGLRTGDAHIIRNAGGFATDDVIRSLIVSQQLLGTTEIIVIGHTGCGLLQVDESALHDRLANATGHRASMVFGAFDDLEESIKASLDRLRRHPWLESVAVHGLIFDVRTGGLREVE